MSKNPKFGHFGRHHRRIHRGFAKGSGINVPVLLEGSKDWFWKATIGELDAIEIGLDIHHIFPRKWCTDQKTIERGRYESILNKTQISYKANRKIGGDAPSLYVPRIQSEKRVALDNAAMNDLLVSHALSPELLRADAFDGFLEDRKTATESASREGDGETSR